MSTTNYTKSINRRRDGKVTVFDAYLGAQLVGTFDSRDEAQAELDRMVFNYLVRH